MPLPDDLTRRTFLAGATAAAAAAAVPDAAAPVPVPLANPNILVIIVDQMRFPSWLNAQQAQQYRTTVIPNIQNHIINKSVGFSQYYTAAAFCTPARSTLLTGLYASQTALFITPPSNATPTLDPAFPTWGQGLPAVNPAYAGKMWWFGKWHLSAWDPAPNPLAAFGFQTTTFPGPQDGSPNGWANEGINGGVFTDAGIYNGRTFASDAEIVDSFLQWARSQAGSGPWCTTVSLLNPHDIAYFPNWFNPTVYPQMAARSLTDAHYPPPPAFGLSLYTALPNPWNLEQPAANSGKPSFQYSHWKWENGLAGPVNSDSVWVTMLNTYYALQRAVDQQIGRIFQALPQSVMDNTIVVFLSDHGEHCGSHGQRGKGGGVYEESIHSPLYVRFPSLTAMSGRTQLVSSVDLFGLICDLGTMGSGAWRTEYPDLATRESIYNFIFNPAARESHRLIQVAGVRQPYILHTVDEVENLNLPGDTTRNHIIGLRLKTSSTHAGAKYAAYSHWAPCTVLPDGTGVDEEFYDYGNALLNKSELGNNINTTAPASLAVLNGMRRALNSSVIPNELNRPLVGPGLATALANAQARYFAYLAQCAI